MQKMDNSGTTAMEQKTDLRISAIINKGKLGALVKIFGPMLDRLLGIRKVRLFYERHNFRDLEKFEFIDHFIEAAKIQYGFDRDSLARIPSQGPVVIVANHPLGGLEGILLASILNGARPDYRIFANIVQYYLKELASFYIFVNPMFPGSRENYKSLDQARKWLAGGHCLLIFPAGRVGVYRSDKGYVTDEAWDKVALSLGLMTKAVFIPLFVTGSCSTTFSTLSRFIYPMKLFMLIHEFFNSFRKRVDFFIGRPIERSPLESMGRLQANAWLRMRTYLLAPLRGSLPNTASSPVSAAAGESVIIPQTTDKILLDDGRFKVFYNDTTLNVIDGKNNTPAASGDFSETCGLWTLSGLKCYSQEKNSTAKLLFHALETFRPLSFCLSIAEASGETPYSPHSIALLSTALTKKPKRQKKCLSPKERALRWGGAPRVHNEVEDYIDKYGLNRKELEEIICAVEGDKKGLPFFLSELLDAGAKPGARAETEKAPVTLSFILN